MMRLLFTLVIPAMLACDAAKAAGVLSVSGLPPQRVAVLAPWAPTSAANASGPEMQRRVAGLIEVIEGAAARKVAACGAARAERALESPCAVLVLEREDEQAIISVSRSADGSLVASNAAGEATRLRPGALEALFTDWGAYRGRYEHDATDARVRGIVTEIPQPLGSSPLVMNSAALRSRFFAGGGAPPPARRVLRDERMFVRAPREYSPARPAGLIVWVSPSDRGEPPMHYHQIADDLHFVLAGAANAGNERPLADRLQLALDVVQNARERFHIDRERVYITGLSGGGKVSTILWSGASDVLFGAIPVAGTGYWQQVAGRGGTRWPRLFGRPDSASFANLKMHRLAQITGSDDFNRPSVTDYTRAMDADGLAVRLFDIEGMGHELPPEAALREAVRWVDEPWQSRQKQRADAAREAWAAYTSEFGTAHPDTERARSALAKVIDAGPWTEEAWNALRLLAPEAPPAP